MQELRKKTYNLLRRGERYTKTDNVYLAKGGFWLVSGHIIQAIFGLILLIAFANLLPKEAYGTYQFIISLAAIVGTFTLTGMGLAVTRAVSQGSEGSLRYGFQIQLIWSIGIIISSGVLSIYYHLKDDSTLAISLLIVGALQPFISGLSLYGNFLTGKQAFKESAILSILNKALPFFVLLPALFITDNALIIIFLYFSSHLISLLISYIFVIRRFQLPKIPSNDLSNYSKHLSVMTGISKIAEHLDKVLVWHFLGAAPVAAYTLAQMPIYHMQSLFHTAHQLSFAKIAKKPMEELQAILPLKIRNYFLLILIIVISYITLAPFIFKIFFPNYPESIIYSQLIALSLLATPRNLIQQSFTAHQKKKELYKISLSTPIIRIGLLLILLPIFGIWGAVTAILITEFYNTVLQTYLFRKK